MRARCALATGIAVVCATTLGLAQTTPSGQQRQTGLRDDERTVTVVGCLQEEKDVHGQRPNVAERAGVGEDFVLTQASMKSGNSGSASDSSAKGTSGTSGSAGTGSTATSGSSTSGSHGMAGSKAMYKIKGLNDEKLRPLVNKRVEVVGTVAMQSSRSRGSVETGTTGPTGSGTTGAGTTGTTGTTGTGTTGTTGTGRTGQHEMPELRATSIKEVAGSCQSTQ